MTLSECISTLSSSVSSACEAKAIDYCSAEAIQSEYNYYYNYYTNYFKHLDDRISIIEESIFVNECNSKTEKEKEMRKDFRIVDYRTYENRVVIVTFEDNLNNKTEIKSVCNKDDKFDLERGIEVCVFKYLHGEDTYKQIIKEANRQIKAVDKAKEDKKKEEELIARKKAKAARKKAKRLAKQRQNRINEMQEAFFGAMVKHDSYLEKFFDEDDLK